MYVKSEFEVRLQSSSTLISQDEEFHILRIQEQKLKNEKQERTRIAREILNQEQIKTENLVKCELDRTYVVNDMLIFKAKNTNSHLFIILY